MLTRHVQGFAILLGGVVVAFGLLGITPVAAVAATGSCEVTPRTAPVESPYLGEIEGLIQTQARGSESHEGEALPEDNVGTEIQRELGSQYGGEWYEVEAGNFAVGLTSGPITIQQATETVHETLTRMIEPHEVAFAEAHVRVLPVPYSPAELTAAAASILHELEAIGAGKVASIGQTVGEVGEPRSAGNWPQVRVIFFGNATQAECEAATPIFARYGGEVSYRREEGAPSGEVGATLVDRTNPSDGGEQTPDGPGVSSATYPLVVDDGLNADAALHAVIDSLKRRDRQGAIKTRMTLVLPRAGRLEVRIWVMSGRTRKLVAVGVAPAHVGKSAYVVPVKRTALGQRLHGQERHQMVGEVRLLSTRGDITLAT
jgi:hypothetical protein